MIAKTIFLPVVICITLLASGLDSVSANPASDADIPNHAVILQYHHVSDKGPASTTISIQRFGEHMEYLANNGFQVKSLAEVVSALQNRALLPDKTVVITFDDAFQSIYQNAYPVLKQKSWPFTIFVNTTEKNKSSALYLNWDQLREMAENGAMIANHSLDHPHLLERLTIDGVEESRAQWLARVEQQITGMQAEIVRQTGRDDRYFAYPYGEADLEVRKLVKKLGFVALGQHSGPIGELSDFSFLPRFPMSGVYSGLKPMKTKLHTLPFPIEEQALHQPVIPFKMEMPELRLVLNEGNYRLGQLTCYASELGRIPAVIESGTAENREPVKETQVTVMVQSEKPIITGRSRYNCTAPHRTLPRYYWFSAPWYRMRTVDQSVVVDSSIPKPE
ncbi:MAG: polysaccharide deacetylase family protein [Pseudomonadales bacterium]|nr:polysaccharide deacetylase family protein [Pseudomonadales bacterium]